MDLGWTAWYVYIVQCTPYNGTYVCHAGTSPSLLPRYIGLKDRLNRQRMDEVRRHGNPWETHYTNLHVFVQIRKHSNVFEKYICSNIKNQSRTSQNFYIYI